MKHREFVTVLVLGFGLVSSVDAQESTMGKASKMQMDSTMKKDSKMHMDAKMQMDSTMKKDSKMHMDAKMQMDPKMHKDSKKGSMMSEVALHEYCPVAYLAEGKATKGDAMFSSTYKGKTYHFAGGDAKKMFDAAPAKYVPKYAGYCATAMAAGKKIDSDPELFSVYHGATFLFSSKEARTAFDHDPAGTTANADKHFAGKGGM